MGTYFLDTSAIVKRYIFEREGKKRLSYPRNRTLVHIVIHIRDSKRSMSHLALNIQRATNIS